MEIISGWQVFSKDEMNNENAIKVFSDMIQNFENDIPKWKEECGMRKLLECQRNACYKAIKALETLDKIKRVVDEWSKGEYPYSNNHMCEIKNIIS